MNNVKKPEPVAWRTYRSKRWCFAYSPNRKLCQCDSDWQGLITTEQSEAYANALAAEGIRNALKIAAAIAASKTSIDALQSIEASLAVKTAQEIKTHILALIIE